MGKSSRHRSGDNSVIAVMEIGLSPIVIAMQKDCGPLPHVVSVSRRKKIVVGQMARQQKLFSTRKTFYAIKRFIGRSYDELSQEAERVTTTYP